MRAFFYLLFLLMALSAVPCLAQGFVPAGCSVPLPPGADDCAHACVYCELDGFTGVNDGTPTGGSVYCTQISVQNDQWFGFVAGSSSIEFTIITNNCNSGDGLQAAIVENCSEGAIACNPGMDGGAGIPLSVLYTFFIPGRTYYLVLDGWTGDVCDYEIQVSQGITLPLPAGPLGAIQGPALVCPGATVTYAVPEVSFAGYYHWTAPPGASINGFGNNMTLPAGEGHEVTVTFGNAGGQVCVSAGNVCTPPTATVCKSVANQPIPPTILPPAAILFDDLPFQWEDGTVVLTDSGIYFPEVIYQSWLGCDSVVKQKITVLPYQDGYVTGIIFWDINDNGIKDPGEPPFGSGAVVKSSSGALTNSGITSGKFTFTNQNIGDTITAVAPQPGLTVNPAFRTVQSGVFSGYDFGLFPVPQFYDLGVNIGFTILRPGFNATITLVCRNSGFAAIPGAAVSLEIPFNVLDFLNAVPAPFSVVGNIVEWQLGTMQPNELRYLTVEVNTPAGTPLGTSIQFAATITPITDDITPTNNFTTKTGVVVGAYDPNDKKVVPEYITPSLLANGLPVEYTIRFQNTGNYPADFVRIIDTLGATVDPATFRFVASSHPCTWNIRGTGVVEFFFENIQLPDSSSNEPASHGFVQFTVKPKSNLALGTLIRNFCDIYFDFNPPVRTNTAGTQVVYFIPGEGLAAQDALLVRPNPSAFHVLCNWKAAAPADGRIRLFDVTGLPRLELGIAAGQTYQHIDVGSLPPGLYFVVLEAGNLVLTNRVVVVQAVPLGWN